MSAFPARAMHAAYFPPTGGCASDMPARPGRGHSEILRIISSPCWTISKACLTENRIFKQRNVDIGILTRAEAEMWGMSGRDAALPPGV